MTLAIGQVIEQKYRIVRVLGVGGMGSVYEGENVRIHRKVAIKVLHESVASKADIVQRFEREAQAAGRIGSEHIVEVLDLGNLPSGERFMVMEYLDGDPLTNRIKARGRLSAQEAAPVLRQLLEGLAAAHVAGIIHRDLKPDNVYIVRRHGRDFVKILDFGVSKFSGTDSEFSMTRTGAVMGTPYYMSPEQARGQQIDNRSDLYSVGVVAYQAVTGKVPFHAETFNELIFKIALETPEPIENTVPGFDPGFSAIVRKAMMREPHHRFSTAYEFAQAIDAWAAGAPAPQHYAPQQMQAQALHPAHASSQPGVHGTSGANLGISGSGHLGQSGSGPHAVPHARASHAGAQLAQSGGHPTAGSAGAHPMGQSQVALSVTTPEPKRSPLVAAIAITAVLGIGGGLAAYKLMGASGASGTGAAATGGPAVDTAATATPTPQPETTAQPTAEPTATPAPTVDATTAPTNEPSAVPEKVAQTPPGKQPPRSGQQTTPPKATSTPQQPPPSSGAGRSIGTDL